MRRAQPLCLCEPPRRAAALGLVAAVSLALPASATEPHPALSRLIPLVEVYSATGLTPAFDIAGIRCAGLFAAQEEWALSQGRQGMPSRARLNDVSLNLDRAQITRDQAGMTLAGAHSTTQADFNAVVRLYMARFTQRQSDSATPWNGDGLITSDTAYCDLLNGRR